MVFNANPFWFVLDRPSPRRCTRRCWVAVRTSRASPTIACRWAHRARSPGASRQAPRRHREVSPAYFPQRTTLATDSRTRRRMTKVIPTMILHHAVMTLMKKCFFLQCTAVRYRSCQVDPPCMAQRPRSSDKRTKCGGSNVSCMMRATKSWASRANCQPMWVKFTFVFRRIKLTNWKQACQFATRFVNIRTALSYRFLFGETFILKNCRKKPQINAWGDFVASNDLIPPVKCFQLTNLHSSLANLWDWAGKISLKVILVSWLQIWERLR